MVWKTYAIPHDWTVGNELLRHTLGAVRYNYHFFSPNAELLLLASNWATYLGYHGIV